MSYNDKWDQRADRAADDLYSRPINTTAKWGCIGTLIVLVLVVIIGIGGLAGGWFNGAKETVGFDNSKAQTTRLLDDEKAMIATAGNVCDIKDTKSDENSPTLVEDPAFAYKAKYREIKADYDRRIQNAYEGRFVPKFQGDALPREAPTLNERLAEVC